MVVETPATARTRLPRVVGDPATRAKDTLDVPVLLARRGGLAMHLARRLERVHPVLLFAIVMLSGLAVLSAASIGLGLLVTHVVEACVGNRCGRRARQCVACRAQILVAYRSLADRVDHRRRCRTADRRGGDRGRLRSTAEMADRGLRCLRARGRGGGVSGDDARRPYAPASRRSSRESAGQRQLPVRTHRGLACNLRRARPALDIEVHERPRPNPRMEPCPPTGCIRGLVADVSRYASPARRCRWRFRRRRRTGRRGVRLPSGRCRR